MKDPMHSIRFSGFYEGFKPEDSLFWRVANSLGYSFNVVTSRRIPVDLEVHGSYIRHLDKFKASFSAALLHFGLPSGRDSREVLSRRYSDNRSGRSSRKIFESAENSRVPQGGWDLSISFDLDPYDGSNFYTPYWWFATDLFQGPIISRVGRIISIDELRSTRKSIQVPEKFCATVIRNPEAIRMRAIEALAKIGDIDIFGPHSGRPLTSKTELEGQYRFILAFENDLFPGYVTEKPIEAWAMGAIPLWYGLDKAESLNQEALINAADFSSLSKFALAVAKIEKNHELWTQIYQRPLLNIEPDPDRLIGAIHRLLDSK